MSERYPFQVHVSLRLYGASREDLKLALDEAYKQLADGVPESHTVLQGHAPAFTFNTTQQNVKYGPGPVPKPPSES